MFAPRLAAATLLAPAAGCAALVDVEPWEAKASGGGGTGFHGDDAGSGDAGEAAGGGAAGRGGGPTCGDDRLDPPEQCDDGDLVSGDGCSEKCEVECPVGEQGPDSVFLEPVTLHCLRYSANEMTWAAARVDCASWGGYLAKIGSAAEQAFVEPNLPGQPHVWIGARDERDAYRWDVDGTLVTWQKGSVVLPQGGCARIVGTQGWDWYGAACDDASVLNPFLCERHPAGSAP